MASDDVHLNPVRAGLVASRTDAFRALALIIVSLVSLAFTVRAADTFVVTTNSDSGPGSLRQAVADVNAVGAGTVLFSNVTGTITLTNGEMALAAHLTLVGPGPTNLTISQGGFGRIFKFHPGSTSSVSGVTIMNGSGVGDFGGGGVNNGGNLALTNCVIRDCTSYGPSGGGGLCNGGTMTLESCAVLNNSASPGGGTEPGKGGGIHNRGILTVNNSVVALNRTSAPDLYPHYMEPGHGGGIYNLGSLFLTRSSITGNESGSGPNNTGNGYPGGSGGGLYNASFATLNDCTLSGNRCGGGGNSGRLDSFYLTQTGGNGGSGGGIYNAGTNCLTNCTVYANLTGSGGNGAFGETFIPRSTGDGGNGGMARAFTTQELL